LRKQVKSLVTLNTILFIICIPMFLITTNVRFAVNDVRLYEYGFDKFEASSRTALEEEELTEAAHQLIDYFNSDEEYIDLEIFTQREIDHLKDVKGLIQLVYRLQLVSLAYIVLYIVFNIVLLGGALRTELARRLIWGSWTTIALLAALGLIALVGFDELFLWFHLASFRNDLWLLYPGDNLLLMFPEGFFSDATLFIAGATILEALIIWGIAWGYLKLIEKRLSPQDKT